MRERDKRRKTIMISEEMLEELKREAERQHRSLSFMLQWAWTVSKGAFKKMPSYKEMVDDPG